MNKRYWHIQGYDSLNVIYSKMIPMGYISESKVQRLLQMLTARASLNYEEIVGAMVRKKTKDSNQLLEVLKDGTCPVYSVGDNPHFHARIVVEAE